MSYCKQPYLVSYHTRTANIHVHVVNTLVGRDGKKINRDFEPIGALKQLNKVLGIDQKHNVRVHLEKAPLTVTLLSPNLKSSWRTRAMY